MALTDEQLEVLSDVLAPLFQYLEREVIADIARRIKKTLTYTRTAELQAMAMRELGYSPARIRKEAMKLLNADPEYRKAVAKNTLEYKRDVRNIINDVTKQAYLAGNRIVANAGNMAWISDLSVWKSAGKELTDASFLPQLVEAFQAQTAGELENMTQTTGFKAKSGYESMESVYRRELDKAVIKICSGTFSHDKVLRDVVTELSQSGLRSIDYASGRSMQLDTAANLALRTGCHQLAGRVTDRNIVQTGENLTYVSKHLGARNTGTGHANHEQWQGKVYYISTGKDYAAEASRIGQTNIESLWETTGYSADGSEENDPLGLNGYNCRHNHHPWFEGISQFPAESPEPKPVTVGGKVYDYYAVTQRMRLLERGIRALKREKDALQSLKMGTTEIDAKIKRKSREYREFCKQCNVTPKNNRLRYEAGSSDLTKTKVYDDYQKMSKDGLKDIPHDVKMNPMNNDAQIINNTVSQPDISQPRAEKYADSPIEKSALLNVVPEDLPLDMSVELRKNIVRNANEVYHLGTKNSVEYATVFDADTGGILDPAMDYRLVTQGKMNSVYLDEKMFTGRGKDSVSIAHNHTNGTIPSNDDIDMLLSHDCVKNIFLSADGRLLRIAKNDKMEYNLIIESAWDELDTLIRDSRNIEYAMADSTEGIFAETVRLFAKHGIRLERW